MTYSFPRGLCSFYIRVYQIVDDPSLDPIISWSKSNNSFIVWNVQELGRKVLPKSVEFGSSFSQFISLLEYYGFKRVKGPGQWEFGHEDFVRDQPQLLKKMMFKAWSERIVKARPKRKAKKERVKVENLLQNLKI